LAEYGFDIVEEWDRVSLRRLWVLIKGLPPSATVWTGEAQWTRQDELLASLVERVDAWGRLNFIVAGGKPDIDPDRYGQQIKRPDEAWGEAAEKKKREITTDTRVIAQWFAENS
jgi:hypothetical protein